MMTTQEIQSLAPAIFTTQASPKMSEKYIFVPTFEIMENFQNQGWNLSSVKQVGGGIHNVHELRFRNSELPKVGDTLVEAIVRNSHNGLATFSVSAGLHRLVCSNGLTVPTSIAESFNVRHKSFEYDDVKKLTESFASRLPIIQNSVDKMMNRELTDGEKVDFVRKANMVKWVTGSVPSTLKVEDILQPRRVEDQGNSLWKVFNVVQEKFVRGGIEYRTNRGRKTSLKGLKNIMAVNKMNTKLWELAEEMC